MVKKFLAIAIALLPLIAFISACSPFSGETINTSPGSTTILCPAAGTARAAIMPPLSEGNHASLVYTDADPNTGYSMLSRYDTITHRGTTIVSTANAAITEAQISPDRQWILFNVSIDGPHAHNELRLIRVDGQYQQTLFCMPYREYSSFQGIEGFAWSPNVAAVAVMTLAGKYQLPTTYMIDIAQGQVQTELESIIGPIKKTSYGSLPQYTETFDPVQWLDGTHLYFRASKLPSSSPYPPEAQQFLYLLDTGKGANQHESDLLEVLSPQQMVSKNGQVCNFDSSGDGTQLYTVSCPSSGFFTTPPTSVLVQPADGGPAKTLLHSKTLAIVNVSIASANTLLLLVNNSTTTDQNGIWKINSDGTGLTRVVAYYNPSFCGLNNGTCSNVSPDGSLYAMVKYSSTGEDTLNYGSLNRGPLTEVAQFNGQNNYFAGWIMM